MTDEQAGSAYEGVGLLDTGSTQAQTAPDANLSDSERRAVELASGEAAEKSNDSAAKLSQRIHTEDTAASQQMRTAFLDALPPEKKTQFLQVLAPKTFEAFMGDDNKITDFGKDAVEGVNAVVDQLIDQQKNVKIPEVDDLLEQANRDLDGFVAKYNDQINADGKKSGRFATWFRNGKRKAEDFAYDRQSLSKRLDILDGKVIAKREDLKASFYLILQLLAKNKESINALIGVIAALEAVHEVAQGAAVKAQADLSRIDKSDPHWQDVSDRLARIAEVSNAIEQQHANYMARLAVAHATNSQVRNLLRTQSTVVRNLSMVHIHTVPMMKLSISQIGAITKVKDASRTAESIKDANEHAMEMLSTLSSDVLPDVEKKAQEPIISAEAITSLSDSVVTGNQRIVEAIKQGREARVALENAVMAANAKIQVSDKLRDEELVKALLNSNTEDKKITDDFVNAASNAYDPTASTTPTEAK